MTHHDHGRRMPPLTKAMKCLMALSLSSWMSIVPTTSSGASPETSHLPPSSFLHLNPAMAKPSSTIDGNCRRGWNRRRPPPPSVELNEVREGDIRDSQGDTINTSPTTVNPAPIRSKTGLRHMCPPLDGPKGAPPLPVLTTKDPRTIERWLEENVYSDTNEYKILGFDQESIAKPPWMPQRTSLPDGPATIQLSTPSSCIIIQLSRCGDGSATYAPAILRSIINNPKIIKVGVGIDDDALELYRWSKSSGSSLDARGRNQNNGRQNAKQTPLLSWEMTSRLDIGCILPNKNPSRRSGIRELAQTILGVEINKSKKLSMSNWGNRHLTPEQISYAARDAWVSAAIVDHLQKSNVDTFRAESLMAMDFMKNQRNMVDMDARALQRKKAKLELKAILEGNVASSEGTKDGDENDIEERKRLLHSIMDLYRPDQPPTFSEAILELPLF